MKKVLITGSGGFIGSHLTELLVKKGYDVRCLVTYNSRNNWGWLEHIDRKVLQNIEVIAGDIRDQDTCFAAVNGVDSIFHLAALIAIPYSFTAPNSYISTNVIGTLNILQAAKRYQTSKVICTSTSETYGTAQFVPISEKHPMNAQSPYAASKVAADQLCLSFYHSFALPVTVLRPFNTYGPRQSARAVIPTIISQVASGKHELKLGSVSPTRDFTFVSDTAMGFMLAMQAQGNCGKVMNIGSNFEISIADTVKAIAEVMNANILVKEDPARIRPVTSEVERLWADTKIATEGINWQPEFSGIDGFKRGLSLTAKWFSKSENLKKYKAGDYNI